MGHTPTLAAGVIALVTLFCLEGLISRLSRWAPVDRLVNNRPVLLMAGPRPITTHLERYHVTDTELRTALRLAGVTAAGQVAAVVLEPTGAMSVLRRVTPIDPRLLAEVRGWELVPAEVVAGGREFEDRADHLGPGQSGPDAVEPHRGRPELVGGQLEQMVERRLAHAVRSEPAVGVGRGDR